MNVHNFRLAPSVSSADVSGPSLYWTIPATEARPRAYQSPCISQSYSIPAASSYFRLKERLRCGPPGRLQHDPSHTECSGLWRTLNQWLIFGSTLVANLDRYIGKNREVDIPASLGGEPHCDHAVDYYHVAELSVHSRALCEGRRCGMILFAIHDTSKSSFSIPE